METSIPSKTTCLPVSFPRAQLQDRHACAAGGKSDATFRGPQARLPVENTGTEKSLRSPHDAARSRAAAHEHDPKRTPSQPEPDAARGHDPDQIDQRPKTRVGAHPRSGSGCLIGAVLLIALISLLTFGTTEVGTGADKQTLHFCRTSRRSTRSRHVHDLARSRSLLREIGEAPPRGWRQRCGTCSSIGCFAAHRCDPGQAKRVDAPGDRHRDQQGRDRRDEDLGELVRLPAEKRGNWRSTPDRRHRAPRPCRAKPWASPWHLSDTGRERKHCRATRGVARKALRNQPTISISGEELRDLDCGILGGIGAVHGILAHGERELLADGALAASAGLVAPIHFAMLSDGILAFQHLHHDPARRS